jgi:hypothetical protein
MPEDIYGMEECKMPAWARDKMFPHHQGAFPFPELQLSRGELHFDCFCYSVPTNSLPRFEALHSVIILGVILSDASHLSLY